MLLGSASCTEAERAGKPNPVCSCRVGAAAYNAGPESIHVTDGKAADKAASHPQLGGGHMSGAMDYKNATHFNASIPV